MLNKVGKNTSAPKVARIVPTEGMDVLSQQEVARLKESGHGGLYDLFRRCCLAVVNSGALQDDPHAMLAQHSDFDVRVVQQDRGIKLELVNAPASAFVDGKLIEGIRELLFAVLRDVVYVSTQIREGKFALDDPAGITDAVFSILRHAGILQTGIDPNLIVCWGGHSIARSEYDYTKDVGYQLGLRGLDICTGCGPGAMKGPMKGATIAHYKQRRWQGRYIGVSEPGIIAAESPNPIVNQLVIMPDIEKRLEAFVRIAHGVIVFPGGVGTAEEILYLLGILLDPANRDVPVPLIFTAPKESADYFSRIDEFIGATLGEEAQSRYQIIVGDPEAVAQSLASGVEEVKRYRIETKDAFFFNWGLHVRHAFQIPFRPTHENMAALDLTHEADAHDLAADLRRAFSGIVAGNVKDEGMEAIAKHGKYRIHGDPELLSKLDQLLASFVQQQRMKLPGSVYEPCYQIAR
ncbi:MAG: nucleotide 5'-monophosphate nucleosidase PpnN [Xanthomonadales bacterium]|nr:nucleotide 5'-monophosphate nucleosidase PpnN [Xanthomonadales bacterium]